MIDLLELAREPSWKAMLLEMVRRGEIDPWDVDLERLATLFIQRIKEMRRLELRVPANVILAASILLRLKVYSLGFWGTEEEKAEEVFGGFTPEIPEIQEIDAFIPSRIVMRRVTLEELIQALEEVMEFEKRKRPRTRPSSRVMEIEVEIEPLDVSALVNEVLSRVKALADPKGWVLFSELLLERDAINVVRTLIALLHLVYEGKVRLLQDRLFGEIYVKMVRP